MKYTVIIFCIYITIITSGCCTYKVQQIKELKVEIDGLNKRINKMQQDIVQLKTSTGFVKRLLDEFRYEPVVNTELIGVP